MKKNYFTKNLTQSLITLSFVSCLLFASSMFAQKNIGWTGATNNNWSTATNWNYPAITSVATFGANATVIKLTAANTEIAVGDKVAGYGIPAGATVTAIDATSKDITISAPATALVGTPGTNVVFTFATPKPATAAPSIIDIALISNGANPTLAAGSYYLGGLTISNETGPVTGSTLTIPADVEIFVESQTNEAVLVKGGNIVNDGYLDIRSSLATGTNNQAGAYGMTFGLPAVVPSTPTEYVYSGMGTLKIDTSAANQNSGAILFNGFGVDGSNATYKILFDGQTTLVLSNKKTSPTGSANTQAIRAQGHGSLAPCKIILGGAGFDIGDALSGGINGLFSGSAPGLNVTIAEETTFNIFTNENHPMSVIGFYAYGGGATPINFTNKGTIAISGTLQRSAISMSTEYGGIVNFINEGTINIDIKNILGNQAAIFAAGYQAPAINTSECNVINSGTISIKNVLNGASAGYAIYSYVDGNKSPFMNITNSGILNLAGSNFSTGGRAFNVNAPTSPGTRLLNSGTIVTNQELRAINTTNTSTGSITFTSTPENTTKLMTFNVLAPVAAALGTTYTDSNSNVHTVVVAKVSATGTTLVTQVASNIVNPAIVAAVVDPPTAASALTKTGSGAGDASIVFSNHTANNDNAHFQAFANSGTLNTNPGNRLMTGINGFSSVESTSVLSPGGDTKNGLVTFGEVAGDTFALRGTLKMQASGNAVAGIDFDAVRFTGGFDIIDISEATLDLTGIYIPTEKVTVDIITSFVDPAPLDPASDKSGAITGQFATVIAPKGWSVNYIEGLGGKVQIVFDAALATPQFAQAKFSYYPNPTKNILNVSAAKNINKVALYNVLGQKVLTNIVNATQKQVDISNLQKGIYMMEVTIENTKETFKIVKD